LKLVYSYYAKLAAKDSESGKVSSASSVQGWFDIQTTPKIEKEEKGEKVLLTPIPFFDSGKAKNGQSLDQVDIFTGEA
jgi:hypothetical protein